MTVASMRRAHGFTLIELVVAMLLLSMGLVLAFAVLRSAQSVATRGEAIAAGNERMRAVEDFLRRRLSAALPIPWSTGGDRQARFIGEPDRLAFVADLPAYLGQGGPYLHELRVHPGGAERSLDLKLSLVQGNMVLAEAPTRAPERLADGLRTVAFRYRGRDPEGNWVAWQTRWPWPERLPVLVEIAIEPEDGVAWPLMVVALPQEPGASS
jgi:general secretion pathway protein J